ncbi:hypothetical protein SCUCBS95973_007312 [Sporothrix curviconia]|uniref:Alginate lyase domain-containing protein n=1 Tax=Sporothrix curviconia TaxID=1260050 RepID=A0ABP0CCR5_9PEZI
MAFCHLSKAMAVSVAAMVACQAPAAAAWVHPGILETTADLTRVKTLVASGDEPWNTAYTRFAADAQSSSTYALQGPFSYVTRDTNTALIVGDGQFASDSVAALQTSLMWVITGDTAYAEKSLEILNAWGSTLKLINGTDGQLAAALSGSNLVNAAEIMRYTYSWAADDIATFSSMVTDVLVPPASQTEPTAVQPYPFQANWGTSGEKLMLAAAVFTENSTLYEAAKDLMLNSACANLTGSISSTGQSSESGRDQGHTQLGLGNWAEAFTTLLNQNDPTDWFAYLDNRLAAGYEYTAKFMLNQTVPYDDGFYRCDANLLGGPWTAPSPIDIWPARPVYELPYAIYYERGVAMPYTKALIELYTPDGPSPVNSLADGSAWQTLRFRRAGTDLSATITD